MFNVLRLSIQHSPSGVCTNSSNSDPMGQLAWLEAQLVAAEEAGGRHVTSSFHGLLLPACEQFAQNSFLPFWQIRGVCVHHGARTTWTEHILSYAQLEMAGEAVRGMAPRLLVNCFSLTSHPCNHGV
jgi:hypothetical protein